jgi:GTP-binding protein HflX
MYLPDLQEEVLVSDTIGFIRDLPPLLISAFKSTLMESVHADILLHVIDISDPEVETKIQVVNDILTELGRDTHDVIYVFNKIDKVSSELKEKIVQKYVDFSPIFISVKTGDGISGVKERIKENLMVKFQAKRAE